MEINQYSKNLFKKDNIWFSPSTKNVSYPKEGNDICFQLEENSFWFKHRNNCIVSAIENYPPPINANGEYDYIFDIGGGNGYVSLGIHESSFNVCVVEPGFSGILNAKKRGIPNLICSTFEDIKFYPNSIGAIGLFDVLEHVENDREFLKNMHSVLKDNGRLYITVPSYRWLWSDEDISAGHFRRYTLKHIKLKLKESGFNVDYQTYIFSILPIPSFLLRTFPYLLGIHNRVVSYEKQHVMKNFGFVENIWSKELNLIKHKKRIIFGGSCLIVATK